MAYNILMVSIIDGKFNLLNIKRNVKTYQLADQPIFDADQETLDEKCKRANEIIIASDFPSCNYYWGYFPKVSRHYLKEIVVREARQNFGYVGPVRAAFHDVGIGYQDGVPKRRLSCMVVDNADVVQIENEAFVRHKHKINHINALPAALAAVVAHMETPTTDFMVIAVDDTSSTMVISSPAGDVKVARQIPIGFGEKADCNDADRCTNFFNEISKDITNTNLYYLQNFQGSECKAFFMLGGSSLQHAMSQYGTNAFSQPIQFGLSHSPFPSVTTEQATAWAHIFGAIFCHRNYNLLNRQIVLTRNLNRGYRYAMATIVACIVGCGLYLYQIEPVGGDKISDYRIKNQKLETIQLEVQELKNQVNTLNQFSGWKTFYQNTYENQPGWNALFSEISGSLPKEIVIESFRIDPGSGQGLRGWYGVFTGLIKVKEWDDGLAILREFGAKINRSPYFDVQKVRYEPTMDEDNRPTEEIGFEFQLNTKLISQDKR